MRRRPVALAAAAAGLAVAAVPAHSAWQVPGGGTGEAQARSLAAAGHISATGTTTNTVTLTWGAAPALPSGAIRYAVERNPAGATNGWVAACGSSPASPIEGTSCTDTGLTAATSYEYRVTSLYAKWRTQGSPSGVVTTAAVPPPAAGTGTKLRLTACPDGVLTGYKGLTFTSTVQVLNAQNVLVADNPDDLSVSVSVSGTGAVAGAGTSVLTVPKGRGVTSESLSATMDNGNSNNTKNEFVVTASSGALAAATCTVKK